MIPMVHSYQIITVAESVRTPDSRGLNWRHVHTGLVGGFVMLEMKTTTLEMKYIHPEIYIAIPSSCFILWVAQSYNHNMLPTGGGDLWFSFTFLCFVTMASELEHWWWWFTCFLNLSEHNCCCSGTNRVSLPQQFYVFCPWAHLGMQAHEAPCAAI